jgi:DNA-binding transcriptional LysR family regulator
MKMELRHLRYFVAVAQERNFTRAAERLGIAQPPLSRQIKDLENELGAPLFVRDARPIALTEAGRLLLEHAGILLANAEHLRTSMARLIAAERRRYVIGFVGSTIYGPVPQLIRRFREAAPDYDVDLIEMNTVTQIPALKQGRIDAGLGRLTFEDAAISRRVIEKERLVVALPRDHPLAQAGAPIALAEIAAETLILYPSEPRPSYADQVQAIFREHGLAVPHIREVRELQTALGLVAAQSGLCLVPASVQRLKRDDILYRPVAEAEAQSPIILSWRAADTTQATALLAEICSELAAEHAAPGQPTPY